MKLYVRKIFKGESNFVVFIRKNKELKKNLQDNQIDKNFASKSLVNIRVKHFRFFLFSYYQALNSICKRHSKIPKNVKIFFSLSL